MTDSNDRELNEARKQFRDSRLEEKRRQARERRARYEQGKVRIGFVTTPEVKERLRQMASDHGYSTMKDFFESLAMGYESIDDKK